MLVCELCVMDYVNVVMDNVGLSCIMDLYGFVGLLYYGFVWL